MGKAYIFFLRNPSTAHPTNHQPGNMPATNGIIYYYYSYMHDNERGTLGATENANRVCVGGTAAAEQENVGHRAKMQRRRRREELLFNELEEDSLRFCLLILQTRGYGGAYLYAVINKTRHLINYSLPLSVLTQPTTDTTPTITRPIANVIIR